MMKINNEEKPHSHSYVYKEFRYIYIHMDIQHTERVTEREIAKEGERLKIERGTKYKLSTNKWHSSTR